MNLVLASRLVLVGLGAAGRAARLFMRGLRNADDPCASLWVVRGIQGFTVAVAMEVFAGSLLYNRRWLLILGPIFLGEEVYETGLILLALRAGAEDA